MYHRIQTTEYAPVLTYRQPFSCTTCHWRCPSRSYTCTSYHTFRSSFGRTAKFKYDGSAIGAEGPLLILNYMLWDKLPITNHISSRNNKQKEQTTTKHNNYQQQKKNSGSAVAVQLVSPLLFLCTPIHRSMAVTFVVQCSVDWCPVTTVEGVGNMSQGRTRSKSSS